MSDITTLYERLREGVALRSDDAGIRIVAEYEPAGGPGTKVFPPTYPDGGYLIEDRYDEEGRTREVVILDSFQSQANRCEDALLAEIDDGNLSLTLLETAAKVHGAEFRVTSLGAPHRWPDGYFRKSCDAAGVFFDETKAGQALLAAAPSNARSLFEHVPSDLVFGYWISYPGTKDREVRPRVTGDKSVRLARSYTSELVGMDPRVGKRQAVRLDPYNLSDGGGTDKEKGDTNEEKTDPKLSEVGLGNIIAGKRGEKPPPPGAAIAFAQRRAYLGFAPLARLRFPTPDGDRRPDVDAAGRAVLAALGLLADRLAFARPELFLRSGCSLLLGSEKIAFVGAGGHSDEISLDRGSARDLFDHAVARAADAGLDFATEPVSLQPGPELTSLLEKHFAHLSAED